MKIIAHRINTINELVTIPKEYGVEIDVRHNPVTNQLYLNHDPGKENQNYDTLESYLKNYSHGFIIFNIKEAGIESRCLELATKYKISKDNYFLLDVEFPYLYKASRKDGVREIAIRYSEAEPIEMTLAQKGLVGWVWIDTNTMLPLDEIVINRLKEFKSCLVSPDRWGRPEDITIYKKRIEQLNFNLDAVMVGIEYASLW
ncbi:MAG: hypothetical protein Q8L47_04825 [bacterium]|nr:hypothetical protein [bacterium]